MEMDNDYLKWFISRLHGSNIIKPLCQTQWCNGKLHLAWAMTNDNNLKWFISSSWCYKAFLEEI